jgi:hypothetical protein
MEITAQNDGMFSFECTPDINGVWTATVRCSGSTYIMETIERTFIVSDQPTETEEPSTPEEDNQEPTTPSEDSVIPSNDVTFYAGVAIAAVVAVVVGYLFIKRRAKGSQIVIT